MKSEQHTAQELPEVHPDQAYLRITYHSCYYRLLFLLVLLLTIPGLLLVTRVVAVLVASVILLAS